MTKIEDSVVKFIRDKIHIISVFVVLVLTLLLRYSLRGWLMYDMYGFLIPWYDALKANGLMSFLASSTSDYHILYQVLLWVSTFLPFEPIVSIKLISVIFDYITAFAIGYGVYILSSKSDPKRLLKAFGAAMIISALPIVIMNSTIWGQCDIIYSCFLLFCLIQLLQSKNFSAFILFSISLAFKLQAIFFLPVLLVLYFIKKNFSILYFLIPPTLLLLLGLIPGLQTGSVFKGIEIYINQTGTWEMLTYNYPNIHTLFNEIPLATHMIPALLTTFIMFFLMFVYIIMKDYDIKGHSIILFAVWSILTCTIFLPGMHDRYGFSAELIIWFYFLLAPSLKRFLLAFSINLIPMVIYIRAIINATYFTQATMSLLNIFAYILLTIVLIRNLDSDNTINEVFS